MESSIVIIGVGEMVLWVVLLVILSGSMTLIFGQSPPARSVLVAVFRGFSGSLVDDSELEKGLLCGGEDVRNGRSKSISEIRGCDEMQRWFSVVNSCSEVVVALGSVMCGQSPLSRSVLVSAYTGEGQSSAVISGSAGKCRATRCGQSPGVRSVLVSSDP